MPFLGAEEKKREAEKAAFYAEARAKEEGVAAKEALKRQKSEERQRAKEAKAQAKADKLALRWKEKMAAAKEKQDLRTSKLAGKEGGNEGSKEGEEEAPSENALIQVIGGIGHGIGSIGSGIGHGIGGLLRAPAAALSQNLTCAPATRSGRAPSSGRTTSPPPARAAPAPKLAGEEKRKPSLNTLRKGPGVVDL